MERTPFHVSVSVRVLTFIISIIDFSRQSSEDSCVSTWRPPFSAAGLF